MEEKKKGGMESVETEESKRSIFVLPLSPFLLFPFLLLRFTLV
jgi:hypothetical protein